MKKPSSRDKSIFSKDLKKVLLKEPDFIGFSYIHNHVMIVSFKRMTNELSQKLENLGLVRHVFQGSPTIAYKLK